MGRTSKTTKERRGFTRSVNFADTPQVRGEAASAKSTAGFTLFYAVLVASLLLAIGIAIFNITFKELVLSSGSRESSNAFYAADSGIECAFYWDLNYSGISSPAFGFYGDSLASGLQGYWRFEDDTGATEARDSSGKGNDGTLQNMDALTVWVNGQIGGALQFDGLNDFVDVGNQPELDFTGGFTMVAFINRSATQNSVDSAIVSKIGLAGYPGYMLWYNGNTVDLYINGGIRANSAAVLSPGVWYHVAGVWDGTTARMYINGTESASAGWVSAPNSIGRDFNIGRYPLASRNFTGIIDDVRLYNRVLSSTEITRLSQQLPNPQFTNPVGQNSGAMCLGADITVPSTGWDPTSGWNVVTGSSAATTTFDIALPDGRCATVTVAKSSATTTVISRGYNTCNLSDQRRVERAIKATY